MNGLVVLLSLSPLRVGRYWRLVRQCPADCPTPSTGGQATSATRAMCAAAMAAAVCTALPGCADRDVGPGEVVGSFGETGYGHGEFSYPRAIAISPDGLIYVADKTGRIQRFDPQGQWQLSWSMPQHKDGKPTGMTVDQTGRLFVADTHYNRVMVFDRDGKQLGAFGSQGRGPGQFELPTDVAVDAGGFIYVSEYGGNDRISKFAPDWTYVCSFGGPDSGDAALSRPSGLVFDEKGDLWVADACNHRVCRFDRSGQLHQTFGTPGEAPGQLRYPYDVDLLDDGSLLICEYGNNRLQRFDRSGRSLGTWGTGGRKLGQLAYPWGLAVGADRRVYVVDSGSNRVQIVKM